jgi:hypothetical protein
MNGTVQCQCSQEKFYKKKLRFSSPWIIISKSKDEKFYEEKQFRDWQWYTETKLKNEHSLTNCLLWNDGTDIEKETVYTRWGFRFDAPICKKSNAWRWAWIKAFGKLRVIRWTLFKIYWG